MSRPRSTTSSTTEPVLPKPDLELEADGELETEPSVAPATSPELPPEPTPAPVLEPLVFEPPTTGYAVLRTPLTAMIDGALVRLVPGQVLAETAYDFESLRMIGAVLEPCPAPEPFDGGHGY